MVTISWLVALWLACWWFMARAMMKKGHSPCPAKAVERPGWSASNLFRGP